MELQLGWGDLIQFIMEAGGTVTDAEGPVVQCSLLGRRLLLQRRPDQMLCKRYQVEAVRDFLELVGLLR
ncbi:MAG TPA: hypothetical protein VGO93_05020 [Candidatus Xenobia bacterium]